MIPDRPRPDAPPGIRGHPPPKTRYQATIARLRLRQDDALDKFKISYPRPLPANYNSCTFGCF
jgi:hypothetical protein